jgi:hypothetical protein
MASLPPDLAALLAQRPLPVYRAALAGVCLHSSLLAASPLAPALAFLAAAPPPPTAATLQRLIAVAYSLPSDAAAAQFAAAHPAFDLHAPEPLLPALSNFFLSLRWEGPRLAAALAHLTRTESPEALQAVCGMLASAVGKCASWRRKCACDVLARVLPAATGGGGGGGGDGAAAAQLALALAPQLRGLPAATRLRAALVEHVQALKDAAFERTFMAPQAAYCGAVGGYTAHALSLDAEAHGVPSLAALLAATAGVLTSHLPELTDDAKGFADCAGCALVNTRALWEPGNLGRGWQALPPPPPQQQQQQQRVAHPQLNAFCGWRGGDGVSVRDFALRAAREGEGGAAGAASRQRLASVYLAQFARYFEADFLLPRLVTAALALPGEDLAQVVAAVRAAAAPAEAAGGGAAAAAEAGQGGHPGEWLYDEQYALVQENAWLLLESLGVLGPRPGYAPLVPPAPAPGAAEAASSSSSGGGGGSSSSGAAPLPTEVPRSLIASIAVAGGAERGRERAENLLARGEEAHNKWLHPGCGGRSWVEVRFARAVALTGLGLQSANDAPERDPVAWRLLVQAQAGGGGWREVLRADARGGGGGGGGGGGFLGFQGRWEWLAQGVEGGRVEGVVAARLEIDAVRRRNWADGDCVQLGHIAFYTEPLAGGGGDGGGGGGAVAAAPEGGACALL